jgi:hypothetical protein
MTEAQAFAELSQMDRSEKVSYARKGQICLEIMKSLKHRERIDPETGEACSLASWIRLAAPWSYTTCFAAMRDCETLSDLPAEELASIPQSNIAVLKQLSTAVRTQPAVIQAAQTKRSDDFIEQIKKDFPLQHLETRTTLRFVADQTQEYEIEKAISKALERGAMSRTEALCDMAINYCADALLEELAKESK